MKPILVPYDENMTKEELFKAIADAVGSDVETVKKEFERAVEQMQHDMRYEPTYNGEDGSM